MDIIYINDLRIETIIGIYGWERKTKQTVVLDIEMGTDIRKASASGAVEDTLNYKSVAERLISFIGENEFELVETLAEQVANILLDEFAVPRLKLRVNKQGALKGVRDVGVIIERGQKEIGNQES
ncbi:MAG: dihydroneopterin aldolase [Proteobacteria bacterium]|nr:dihydroneopterin aldolase [Pseudomonadota bacterium]MCH8262820.1 dihydroneopterin aldolase [Pseudomonadota bacterium]MCH8976661.1 dihydroneopterin aldolase [Pseudomonadota bacterium]MCH9047488.1 dihydroneopterin aldolase [Pseudomonadota bacterium]